MSFFSRLAEKRKERKAASNAVSKSISPLSGAALVAGTSAALGTVSGNANSAATSRNLQDASTQLNDYLKEIDTNDEGVGDVISMSRFIEKAKAYSNSSFNGCTLHQVNLNLSTLLLLDLAAKSSKKVYNKPGVSDLEPFAFIQIGESKSIAADVFGGSIKATLVSLYKIRTDTVETTANDTTVVVVAIRGTASVHDWMVNLHDIKKPVAPQEAAAANVKSEFLGFTEQGDSYTVHAGFLACAELMAPKVASLITEILSEQEFTTPPALVFTGHSAGGAIATMLHIHMLKTASNVFTPLLERFAANHCLTFGSPPITSPSIPPFSPLSTFISFVNEDDPIPKCDGTYVNSLLKLWVSPMPSREMEWQLPKPILENAGFVVGIPRTGAGEETIFVAIGETGEDGLKGRVFGDAKAHKMDLYLRKVRIVDCMIY